MLDNKNDNFGSADQNKSYGSNDDMVESDKVLWRYEDLLDKLLGKSKQTARFIIFKKFRVIDFTEKILSRLDVD